MDNKKFTRLTLEQNGDHPIDNIKISWEIPFVDVTGKDMCQAFKTILIGMAFSPETINNMFVDYLSEYAEDKYEIVKKEN